MNARRAPAPSVLVLGLLAGGPPQLPSTSPYAQVHCTVRFVGEPPPARILAVDKDVHHCGASLEDTALRVRAQRVEGAVVWLQRDVPLEPAVTRTPVEVRLEPRSCRLEPRVQATLVGTRLVLRNGDPLTHNPHGWLGERTVFNVTLLDQELEVKRTLKSPGVHRVDCDTHPWMRAYVHVFDHPWYGTTDENGHAWLRDAPPGKQIVRLWHEVLGERSVEVELAAGGTCELVIELDLERARPPTGVPAPAGRLAPRDERGNEAMSDG